MTFKALAFFLVSWVLPTEPSREHRDELPVWERHPEERRALREQGLKAADLLSHTPRPW